MIAAIASGKGGTGKTTVTASLASIWDSPLIAVDLDVEEPNLHLFLQPVIEGCEKGYILTPVVDEAKCTYCGACADICQFAAITVMGRLILTFPEMCHGCNGCIAVCPEKAISPGQRELGDISWGKAGQVDYLAGRLRIGEAMSPPLMRLVKARLKRILAETGKDAIIDAPPGVSCPAVNAVLDSDIIILVTEPTPFGFYDFQLACEAFSPFGKPIGAVINRAGLGQDDIYRFCQERGLPILAEIPYDRAIAEAYSCGRIIAGISPELSATFVSLKDKIRELAALSRPQEAAHA
ncbi:nucleotide-binding protein [Desulfobacca acetoxidans]|uniref:Cobyrinic acid ac-diamide synthase n=1 Tax=Desulfobacca acetoxidans (strain ATCC 700848 / DSM 11109 / ASRB2) TaxID=880072 RepID=F2NIF3_DESAR|nr:ATP-binding protein [Desulfobacca acetoxidans]AEB10355.1 Cobyrinic acid ac-diamide synthase [Desulfobacca acetoxidans DSM 11109]